MFTAQRESCVRQGDLGTLRAFILKQTKIYKDMKTNIQKANEIAQALLAQEDKADALYQLTLIADIIATAQKQVKAEISPILQGGTLKCDGYSITSKKLTKYDFSSDRVWFNLKTKTDELGVQMKARELVLKQDEKYIAGITESVAITIKK